jgi:hypothetical protein
LVSLLGIIWLWRDTGDAERVAGLAGSTFWYVLPSLPYVPCSPGDATGWRRLLGQLGRWLRPDGGSLPHYSLGARQVD